jgi:hypothetical protein
VPRRIRVKQGSRCVAVGNAKVGEVPGCHEVGLDTVSQHAQRVKLLARHLRARLFLAASRYYMSVQALESVILHHPLTLSGMSGC